MSANQTIPQAEEVGRLGIPHLFRYWQRANSRDAGQRGGAGEWDLDCTLLAGLNLNVLETARFLNPERQPTFEEFEDWIIAANGGAIDEAELTRLRAALSGDAVTSAIGSLEGVEGLTPNELAFWDEFGYVIVRDAVDPKQRDLAAAAVYEFAGALPMEPDSWYGKKFGVSIWVPLLRHPAFLANRRSPRLIKAFSQLWGREDLWATVDQGGLDPPERDNWKFPGPQVHWDETIASPHRLGVQGILYLTDTPADQGAFCCIPGFHHRLDEWLESLPAGADPRDAIKSEPGLVPMAGKAGDLIIWHHLLPHGSSPNRGTRPRVVQYVSLRPTRWEYTRDWALTQGLPVGRLRPGSRPPALEVSTSNLLPNCSATPRSRPWNRKLHVRDNSHQDKKCARTAFLASTWTPCRAATPPQSGHFAGSNRTRA